MTADQQDKKRIFVITGPSGAGEDSIIKGLKEILPIDQLITTTTRQMRPGEKQGEPYYFIAKEDFMKGVREGKFFEYALEDGGNYYGCTFEEVKRVEKSDRIIIWKVDYQGAFKAKELISGVVTILIDVPPEVIERRIRKRTTVTEEFVRGRLEYAKGWYDNRHRFDYTIANDDGKLEEAITAAAAIIRRESGITQIDKK